MEKEKKDIGFEIRTLSILLKRKHRNCSVAVEIDEATGTNGWVIGYLAHNQDKDVFQRDLEEEFSIRRSTATKILQLMERKGLIIRKPVDYDARLKKIEMTEKAKEMDRKMQQCFKETEAQLRKNLTDKEIEEFYIIIDKMINNLM